MNTSIPQKTSSLYNLTKEQENYQSASTKYEKLADKKLVKSDSIIITGFGCYLRVNLDSLVVYCGRTHISQNIEEKILYKGVHGIKNIILLSEHGTISLDSIKWCTDENIAITMIDYNGDLLQSLTPEHRDDIKLRMLQYQVYCDAKRRGVIANYIITRKIKEQLETLKLHTDLPMCERAKEILTTSIEWLDLKELPARFYDIEFLITYEGRCASVYFETFRDIPLLWSKADTKTIPPHWLKIGDRSSLLSKSTNARYASSPFHSAYNYALSILKRQIKQSLNCQGFDVDISFLHALQDNRDNLVLDLIELHRSQVHELVLQFFLKEKLTKSCFMTVSDGSVRFNPQFLRYFTSSCKLDQSTVDASVSEFKTMLLSE